MTSPLEIAIKVLEHGVHIELPAYATPHSAGMDLRAAIQEDILLQPLERTIIPCGFSIALPLGYEAQVRSRSGLAANHGVIVLNAPGTIDADYRGEIKVILINLGSEPFKISAGMRIAQLVIASVVQAKWCAVPEFVETTLRADQGLGSTGTQ